MDGGLDVRCRVAPEPSNQERRAFGDRLYQEPAVVSQAGLAPFSGRGGRIAPDLACRAILPISLCRIDSTT